MTTFREILQGLPLLATSGDLSVPISGICGDSRAVQAGHLFVALRGDRFDGHEFIEDALARGAAAVVCEPLHPVRTTAPVAVTEDTKPVFGELASAFHNHPSRRLRLIGVTGTDGKTSTTLLTAAILRAAGLRTGHCTTVELHDGHSGVPSQVGFTTPQPPQLQAFLARCADAGCDAVVLEVSSHAIAMGRVAGCEFDVAVFTNLAPEHLDFHKTMEEYREAKACLFDTLQGPRHKSFATTGVVNRDDPQADFFAARCQNPIFYGLGPGSHLTATGIRCTPDSTSFTLETGSAGVPPAGAAGILPANPVAIQTKLLGRFNVYNLLAAATAGLASGAHLEHIREAAANVEPPPGRMQHISAGQPFEVYVDFAHTPQALAAALDTVRELHPGRVAAVFGHAGGRDRNHRSGLVRAARGKADLMVLTMDDPYQEDPAAILVEMRQAALAQDLTEGSDFEVILDRRKAFARAFAWAGPGDSVLLAGRGHETTIVVGTARIDFHDPSVAQELLRGIAP